MNLIYWQRGSPVKYRVYLSETPVISTPPPLDDE
jgi:hypothetical protein